MRSFKWAFACGCAIGPVAAHAHLSSTGMGPVYDGLMHFLSSPEDLVPALGLAMLAGLRGAAHGRRVLIVLPCAWLLGSLFGSNVAEINGNAMVSAAWFVTIGVLVLMDANLSLHAMTMLAGLLGVYHGFLNGTGMGRSLAAAGTAFSLVGAVFVLTALAAAFAVQLQRQWARIAIRVAGSWIAASGLLLIGWSMRG